MMTITPLVSEFVAIGQLQDVTIKSDGRVKYIVLSSDREDYSIKVAKDQPKKLGKKLQIGCKLKVKGMLKHNPKKNVSEYKAYAIELLSPAKIEELPKIQVATTKSTKSKKSKKTKAKVLICQKNNCWKKGGQAVYQELKSELEKRGIAEEVEIKTTGCLKKCKKAPNMVMLPDKEHYVRVKPKQVSNLVEKHLS